MKNQLKKQVVLRVGFHSFVVSQDQAMAVFKALSGKSEVDWNPDRDYRDEGSPEYFYADKPVDIAIKTAVVGQRPKTSTTLTSKHKSIEQAPRTRKVLMLENRSIK